MTNARANAAYAAAHFALELDKRTDLGMFRSIEGGSIKADVMTYQNGGTYDRWRQLGKPKFEDIKLQVGMAMSAPFYEWIKQFFQGKAVRKDGAIVAADFYYKERARREFTDAMIKELTFPKLDGQDKSTAYMSVSLSVEDIKFVKGGGAELKQNAGDEAQKSWKACNFRFFLDGFDCKRVTKVDSFTIKQNILEYASGGAPLGLQVPERDRLSAALVLSAGSGCAAVVRAFHEARRQRGSSRPAQWPPRDVRQPANHRVQRGVQQLRHQ
jgi:phage tail-like protein